MTTRDAFAREFLKAIQAPITLANRRALIAWATAEGTQAAYNPFATTLYVVGCTSSTNFNSVPVRNYLSLPCGVIATVKTLEETPDRGYHPILHRLRRNEGARQVLEAVAASAWGTGALALQILPDVRADLMGPSYGSHSIGQNPEARHGAER